MARGRSLLKGLGILFVLVLLVFVSVFFYAYLTGGEAGVLSALGGDSVGVIEVAGTINDSHDVIESLKHFGQTSGVKAIVLRVDSPGGAVAPTQNLRGNRKTQKEKAGDRLFRRHGRFRRILHRQRVRSDHRQSRNAHGLDRRHYGAREHRGADEENRRSGLQR